jgi:hypothetical protein
MGEDRRWTSGAGSSVGALVRVLWSGCSGGSGSTGPTGVPRTATVVSLAPTQLAALCDWVNASVGGYGSIDNCDGGGSRHANSTQQDCVSKVFGGCPSLTVGVLEDCVNAIGGDLCRTDTAPACVGVNQCGSTDGGASPGG